MKSGLVTEITGSFHPFPQDMPGECIPCITIDQQISSLSPNNEGIKIHFDFVNIPIPLRFKFLHHCIMVLKPLIECPEHGRFSAVE